MCVTTFCLFSAVHVTTVQVQSISIIALFVILDLAVSTDWGTLLTNPAYAAVTIQTAAILWTVRTHFPLIWLAHAVPTERSAETLITCESLRTGASAAAVVIVGQVFIRVADTGFLSRRCVLA